MLQHTISRALRPKLAPSTSPSISNFSPPCMACACRCGNVFVSIPASSQRRYAQYSRSGWARAPSTKRHNRPKPKTGTKERGENILEQDLTVTYPTLDVLAFCRDFCEESDRTRSAVTMEPTKLRGLMKHYGLEDIVAVNVAHLMWSNISPDIRYYGQKMLLSLARAEVLEATIRTMSHARLQHKNDKQMLRSSTIQHARAHLAKAADQKQHYRAMVCEGRVALELGDEERAIEMYTDAMAAAVAAAEQDDQISKAATGSIAERIGRDDLGLSSPWIDLFLLHQYRSQYKGKDEWEKCRWAMEVGCQQDDPMSHYNASTYVSKYMYEGDRRVHIPTSKWMYHVTKAALSQHPVAAYELGQFYAESGWKYLEQDEPPDHVKPTPFDSYPGRSRSLWGDLLMLLGIKQAPKLQPHEGMFLTAAFPHTAVDRYQMAVEWLQIASRKGYAPAFLFKARMFLEQNLWGEADAPQAAIELSNDRYEYASKEDFDNGVTIAKKNTNQAASAENPPNPFYAPEKAKWYLREVFYAHESFVYADQAKRAKAKARLAGRVSKTDADNNVENELYYDKISKNIAKWFRFPEVRDMYAEQIERLYSDAKLLCDDHNMDIYDDDQSLMYRAGTNVGRQTKNLKWWGVHAGSSSSASRRG